LDWLIQYYNLLSVLYFVSFAIFTQLIAPREYHWKENTFSELAAQEYNNKWIMQIGLIGFGMILGTGSLIQLLTFEPGWYKEIPILVYAVSIAMSGVFCTKPILDSVTYDEREYKLHSFFAQLGGMSFVIGLILFAGISATLFEMGMHLIFLVLIMLSLMIFSKMESKRGIAQKSIFLIGFLWLVLLY
jgi:hypothetical membrane protein